MNALLPHQIADLRALADKAQISGDYDAGAQLHLLLDAHEAAAEAEEKAEELEETNKINVELENDKRAAMKEIDAAETALDVLRQRLARKVEDEDLLADLVSDVRTPLRDARGPLR